MPARTSSFRFSCIPSFNRGLMWKRKKNKNFNEELREQWEEIASMFSGLVFHIALCSSRKAAICGALILAPCDLYLRMTKLMNRLLRTLSMLEYFINRSWEWSTYNTEMLMSELSPEDQRVSTVLTIDGKTFPTRNLELFDLES